MKTKNTLLMVIALSMTVLSFSSCSKTPVTGDKENYVGVWYSYTNITNLC